MHLLLSICSIVSKFGAQHSENNLRQNGATASEPTITQASDNTFWTLRQPLAVAYNGVIFTHCSHVLPMRQSHERVLFEL